MLPLAVGLGAQDGPWSQGGGRGFAPSCQAQGAVLSDLLVAHSHRRVSPKGLAQKGAQEILTKECK